jgi:hypothetical protein
MSEYQVGDKVECESRLHPLFDESPCSPLSSDYAIGGAGGGNKNSSTTGVIEDSKTYSALPLFTPSKNPIH